MTKWFTMCMRVRFSPISIMKTLKDSRLKMSVSKLERGS